MMYQMNVREMSNIELSAYKRMIRRRIVIRRRIMAAFTVSFLGLLLAFSIHSVISNANPADQKAKYKYYTCVTVRNGDTMWDITQEYIDTDYYKNKEAYFKEVKQINHLNDDYALIAGQNLILPYYSSEYYK